MAKSEILLTGSDGQLGKASARLQSMMRWLNTAERNMARSVIRQEFRTYTRGITNKLAQRHSKPYPATGRQSLAVRGGPLRRSLKRGFVIRLEGGGTVVTGKMSLPFYARSHEYGAVIKPTRAKYLTIPLPAALNRRGLPKKRRARDWPNTFVKKSKAGNLIIFQKSAENNLTPLYVLKKTVTIPARLGVRKSLQDRKRIGSMMARIAEGIRGRMFR